MGYNKKSIKISKALKGRPKPPRTQQHRINLSKAMSKSYIERYGKQQSKIIIEKIRKSNTGKKRIPRSKLWKKNLSMSLKGRKVWNKGKKGLQKAWNRKELPEKDVLNLYLSENLTSNKIAKKFNVSGSVILRILKEKKVKLKGSGYFSKGKTYEELYGKEVARKIKENLSKKLKGKPVKNWAHKISKGIKKYYKENGFPEKRRKELSIMVKKMWENKEYRNKLVKKHRERLKNNPEELERLKKMSPVGITSIEKRMLSFLKAKNFKEGKDFLFDRQDTSGKTLYRPDFQFPKQKIIIELDGYYKHFTKKGYQRDKIREYYLKKAGWNIHRFDFYDINRNYKFENVKKKVIKILDTKC